MATGLAKRARAAEAGDEGTLTERAYRLIRADILNVRLDPGQPLRLEALKERYGLSFSPIREALNRLQTERLVTSSALRGFRVAGVSRDEMWDTIETRVLIEGEALRRSVERGDDDWEGAVVSAFHAFALCARRLSAEEAARTDEGLEELERRHRQFHAALLAACGSPWLLEFSSQLYAQTERYRRPHLSVGVGTWAFGDVAREHETIMDACLARDGSGAATLLAEHYRRTGRFIEQNEDKG
jgi:GntR family transcriptional regulator, carbon starvation induced regulator